MHRAGRADLGDRERHPAGRDDPPRHRIGVGLGGPVDDHLTVGPGHRRDHLDVGDRRDQLGVAPEREIFHETGD